jgi:hypothetical protein
MGGLCLRVFLFLCFLSSVAVAAGPQVAAALAAVVDLVVVSLLAGDTFILESGGSGWAGRSGCW